MVLSAKEGVRVVYLWHVRGRSWPVDSFKSVVSVMDRVSANYG